jgi:hypothetical protein
MLAERLPSRRQRLGSSDADGQAGPRGSGLAVSLSRRQAGQASNRSAFMTFDHAATKSVTNFSLASSAA